MPHKQADRRAGVSFGKSGAFTQLLGNHHTANEQICVAVLGAGGKSGLLQRLGDELTSEYRNVILTSLTHSEKFPGWTTLLASRMTERELITQLGREKNLQVLNAEVGPGKYSGLSPELLCRIRKQVDICLCECDGARGHSLKAHNKEDPNVPSFMSQAIIVVGADIVNTRIADGLVHRPELFCNLWNLEASSLLNMNLVAKVVTSERGYGQKIPNSVPRVYFVNKAETHRIEAEQLAEMICQSSGFPTYLGSVKAGWCINVAQLHVAKPVE